MSRVSVILAILTIASAALAQEHLVPEVGPFGGEPDLSDEYEALVHRHFAPQQPQHFDVHTRIHHWAEMVSLPSFEREEMVSLEGIERGPVQVVHVKAKRSIWEAYSKVQRDGGDVSKVVVPVERHVASLSAPIQERLLRCWVTFLRTTQYGPLGHRGDDGTTYHFSAFVLRIERLYGKTWSPPPDSLPRLFVDIGTELAAFADAAAAARPDLEVKLGKSIRRAEIELGLRDPTAGP